MSKDKSNRSAAWSLRIALVQPSVQQAVQSLFTFHKKDGLGAKPPMAILSLATHLIDQGYADTQCVDAQLDDLSPEQTVERLVTLKPDLVGITTWTDFWYPVWQTVKLLRQRLPACTIVLGGPHCMVYPEEALQASEADYLVAGDGEEALLRLVNSLAQGEEPPQTAGLWRKTDGRVVAPTAPIATFNALDSVPSPDRSLLPVERYYSVLSSQEFETTMVTSRGCPHKCVFCKMYSQKVYARSAEGVIEEFRNIAALGITDVQVYDDTFTWSKSRVMKICEGILEHKLNIRWAIRDRVSRADGEMYAMLRRAGCYRIHFGIESGSESVLKASGKGTTLDQARQAVALAKDAGLATVGYFMFGFLGETYDDAKKTIAFAKELDPDYAVFAVTIPYPGTTLYDTALERGIVPVDFWRDFVLHPEADFRIPHLIEEHMDRATLIELKDMAFRRYYFTPRRLLKEAVALRSWRELRRKTGMAVAMAGDFLRPSRSGSLQEAEMP